MITQTTELYNFPSWNTRNVKDIDVFMLYEPTCWCSCPQCQPGSTSSSVTYLFNTTAFVHSTRSCICQLLLERRHKMKVSKIELCLPDKLYCENNGKHAYSLYNG